VCVCVCVSKCVRVRVHVHVHVCMRVCGCVCMPLCALACVSSIGHGTCASSGGCVCDAELTGVICNQVICLGGGNCTGHGNDDCFFSLNRNCS